LHGGHSTKGNTNNNLDNLEENIQAGIGRHQEEANKKKETWKRK
jgi:hypothetical protein